MHGKQNTKASRASSGKASTSKAAGRDENATSFKYDQYIKECLEAHNKYRAMHGCPPLKMNPKISQFAKDWAQKLLKEGKMKHRPDNKYGENIYTAVNVEMNGERGVKMWYDEIQYYDFPKAEFSPQAGHFTQLIWKDCKEVGIGLAKQDGTIFVVANYDPPGNVVGQFKENVPKKK